VNSFEVCSPNQIQEYISVVDSPEGSVKLGFISVKKNYSIGREKWRKTESPERKSV